MADDNLEARRNQARLAMEGEETVKRREVETAQMSKRRLEAQIAMESEEQKKKRVNAEQLARSRAIAKERLTQDLGKKRQEENTKAEALKQKLASNTKKEKEAYDAKLRQIHQSELKIGEIKQAPTSTLSSIHTLKSDMARTIRDDDLSMTKIVLQEKDRALMNFGLPGGLMAPTVKKGGHTGLMIFLIVLLLAATASAGVLIFYPETADKITKQVTGLFGQSTENPAPVFVASYLIPVDDKVEVTTEKLDVEGLRAQITQIFGNAKDDKVLTGLAFIEAGKQIDFARWQSKLALGAPASLTGKLGPKFLFGILNLNEVKNGFVIVEVKPNINKSLLEWEANLAVRLLPLIGGSNAVAVFNSRLFQNLEVRVLPNAFGESQMIYTIIGNRYLIITTNEKALENLVGRLSLL